MTNYECYQKQIIEILRKGDQIAVSKYTLRPTGCAIIGCKNCLFYESSECSEARAYWLSAEYKEPIVLTDFEKEVLKRAKKAGYKYIARDKNKNGKSNLFFCEKIRSKEQTFWSVENGTWFTNTDNLFKKDFQFVKWEDEEPYSIEELLQGAE